MFPTPYSPQFTPSTPLVVLPLIEQMLQPPWGGVSFAVCRLLLHISFGEAPHLKQSYEPQILFLTFYKSGNKIDFTNCPCSRLESKSHQASLKVGPRDTVSTIPHGVDQVYVLEV